jgi:hypothetical protein
VEEIEREKRRCKGGEEKPSSPAFWRQGQKKIHSVVQNNTILGFLYIYE